jgi:Ulp1 family protease
MLTLEDEPKYCWNSGIEQWSRGCYDSGKSLFDNQNVIHMTISYPVGVHWLYAIVSMTSKSIVVVDSWNDNTANRTSVANIIKQFLKDEYNNHHEDTTFDDKDWIIYVDNKVPIQSDRNSCGVFTILYALKAMFQSAFRRIEDYSSFEWNWNPTTTKDKKKIKAIRKSIVDVVVGTKTVQQLLNEIVVLAINF